MTEKRHLDTDPLSGAVATFEYDDAEGKAYIHQETDVSGIIEQNKVLQNHTDGWTGPDKTMRRAAHIPNAVIEMWKLRYGVDVLNRDHWPAVQRLLNDPEWRFLRTNTSKL
jgi:hypothetical protein